ncbi:MAG TPA: hypothetical protein VFR23_13720 [Jiangellaceae bacterium]|nr:hypothetical protein [Jiangellaceae bacterium]
MDFFPDVPPPSGEDEPEESPQPAWRGAPSDILPGVVPVELILGRSDSTVVMLTGMRAFPTGLAMILGVRVRGRVYRDLHGEVLHGPYTHDMDADWQVGRLKWGFEFADGRRVTNLHPWPPYPDERDPAWEPDHPALIGGGGGGGDRYVDVDYWLWPLPPAGRLRVACQWLEQGIEMSTHDLDTDPFREAAARAKPIWPPN